MFDPNDHQSHNAGFTGDQRVDLFVFEQRKLASIQNGVRGHNQVTDCTFSDRGRATTIQEADFVLRTLMSITGPSCPP
jgi:hypothetical protein